MVTLAQRIESLRTEANLSRPALAAALGFPKGSIEKFETGRQTPSKEQQEKLAAHFGVSLFYLRGESNDRTRQEDWMDAPPSPNVPSAKSPRGPCWTPCWPVRRCRSCCGASCWIPSAPPRGRSLSAGQRKKSDNFAKSGPDGVAVHKTGFEKQILWQLPDKGC